MTESQWEELQMEDYQYIELADDVDARTFFDCMLASIRGASIKYGVAKKRKAKAEREKFVKIPKVPRRPCLIFQAVPVQVLLGCKLADQLMLFFSNFSHSAFASCFLAAPYFMLAPLMLANMQSKNVLASTSSASTIYW